MIKNKVGILLLVLQICSVIYAQFIPERFFCWRPFDNHTSYRIEVKIKEKQLELHDIEKRYRYKSEGWEPRSIYNVFSIVSQYELSYGLKDSAQVKIYYNSNGKENEMWELNN